MNQRKTDILSFWIKLYDVLSGSALGGFASDRSGSRSCVYPFSCSAHGTEAADLRALGQGRCK
jgi:hypothetical protein